MADFGEYPEISLQAAWVAFSLEQITQLCGALAEQIRKERLVSSDITRGYQRVKFKVVELDHYLKEQFDWIYGVGRADITTAPNNKGIGHHKNKGDENG